MKVKKKLNEMNKSNNNYKNANGTKPVLGEVLSKLAKKKLQVKLIVGYRDCINGYGWHVRYYVEVIKCVEYCFKCRKNYQVDYKDDHYPLHHQHSHRQEYKTILAKEFMSEDDMCIELLNFA